MAQLWWGCAGLVGGRRWWVGWGFSLSTPRHCLTEIKCLPPQLARSPTTHPPKGKMMRSFACCRHAEIHEMEMAQTACMRHAMPAQRGTIQSGQCSSCAPTCRVGWHAGSTLLLFKIEDFLPKAKGEVLPRPSQSSPSFSVRAFCHGEEE